MSNLDITELIRQANSGDIKAQETVGTAYIKGFGVEQDISKAYEFYNMAAANGSPLGMYQLARSEEIGLFGDPDINRALSNYEKAAALGSKSAQNKYNVLKDRQNQVPKLAQNTTFVPINKQAADSMDEVFFQDPAKAKKRWKVLMICWLGSGILMNIYLGYYRRAVIEILLAVSVIGWPVCSFMLAIDFYRIWLRLIPCDAEGNEIY